MKSGDSFDKKTAKHLVAKKNKWAPIKGDQWVNIGYNTVVSERRLLNERSNGNR